MANMIGFVYHKPAHREVLLSEQYPQLDEETKRRMRYARYLADKKAEEEEQRMYAHGICPKCHCFLPSGLNYCPDCKEE